MAVLKATRRDEVGTRKVRRLRQQGKVPCVLYGHGQETVSIALDEHDVALAILHGERLLEISLGGQSENALIKEVQYDTFGQQVLHIDLARVSLDERVEVTISIVLKGTPVGVAEEDGVLQRAATEVRIECAVRSIPEEIGVMVIQMHAGERLTMGELSLPEGAKLLDDPETVVAVVGVLAEEPEEAPAEEGAAQPEVIGETAPEGGQAPAEGQE